MKRIFTLLISLGSIGSVFAQPGHGPERGQKDMAFIKAPYNTEYSVAKTENSHDLFGGRERDREIRQVNREFDRQIAAVKHNRFLRPIEKEQQVRMLEAQRDQKLRMINVRYSDRDRRDFEGGHGRW